MIRLYKRHRYQLILVILVLGLVVALSSQQVMHSAQEFEYKLSTGIFSIPQEAGAIDWVLVNNSAEVQPYGILVYKALLGSPKELVGGRVISGTLEPERVTHDANAVGAGLTYQPGFYYEIIVQLNDLRVLPTINFWENMTNLPIPGTRIGPGDFVNTK